MSLMARQEMKQFLLPSMDERLCSMLSPNCRSQKEIHNRLN